MSDEGTVGGLDAEDVDAGIGDLVREGGSELLIENNKIHRQTFVRLTVRNYCYSVVIIKEAWRCYIAWRLAPSSCGRGNQRNACAGMRAHFLKGVFLRTGSGRHAYIQTLPRNGDKP